WLIESFFKSIKHDFGLKEARLRTPDALKLWLFLSCLAYCLATLKRCLSASTLTLSAAAQTLLEQLTDVVILHLLIDIERFANSLQKPLKLSFG
ncbi:MAG: transposase, partial [Deinococcota bacterium]